MFFLGAPFFNLGRQMVATLELRILGQWGNEYSDVELWRGGKGAVELRFRCDPVMILQPLHGLFSLRHADTSM